MKNALRETLSLPALSSFITGTSRKGSRKAQNARTAPIPVLDRCDFHYAAAELMGWCTNCHEMQDGGYVHVARNFHCMTCDKNTVFGLEQALKEGLIQITEL